MTLFLDSPQLSGCQAELQWQQYLNYTTRATCLFWPAPDERVSLPENVSKEELEVPPQSAWFLPTYQTSLLTCEQYSHLRHRIARLAKAPTKKLVSLVGAVFEYQTFRSRVRCSERYATCYSLQQFDFNCTCIIQWWPKWPKPGAKDMWVNSGNWK